MKKNFRHWIQFVFAAITNGYIVGFVKGQIYKGDIKKICVPGLNCYSCPGAIGSCPIGSLQAVLSGNNRGIPYYVLGFLMLIGVLLGRIVCGFLCPFGFIQDMIYKIKSKKITINKKIDKPLRYLKYVILIVFVFILPTFVRNEFSIGQPMFCKWICPSGTLTGGIPLILKNQFLWNSIGLLFGWKTFLLAIILISSIFIYRPFCKYLCPLGAFYGLFNKISIFKMEIDKDKCVNCMKCEKVCKMGVEVTKNLDSIECIRCGDCKRICPKDAIKSGITLK